MYMTDDTAASVSLLSGEHGMITYIRWLTTVKTIFLIVNESVLICSPCTVVIKHTINILLRKKNINHQITTSVFNIEIHSIMFLKFPNKRIQIS